MIVVSDEAVAAGAASIPSPISDASSPWFVWQPLESSVVVASGVGFQEPSGRNYEVDSKAMRKVGQGEDIALMVQEDNTFGAIVSVTGRMLFKLH